MPAPLAARAQHGDVAAVGVDVHQLRIERADPQRRHTTTVLPMWSAVSGTWWRATGSRPAARASPRARRRSRRRARSGAQLLRRARRSGETAWRCRSTITCPASSRTQTGWLENTQPSLSNMSGSGGERSSSANRLERVGERGGEAPAGREMAPRPARAWPHARAAPPRICTSCIGASTSAKRAVELERAGVRQRATDVEAARARARPGRRAGPGRSRAPWTSCPAAPRSRATRPGAGAEVEDRAAAPRRRARARAAGRRRRRRTPRRARSRRRPSCRPPRRRARGGRAGRAARAAPCRWGGRTARAPAGARDARRRARRRGRAPPRARRRCPAYFSRSAISSARVPEQVTRRTRPAQQLEVGVPDPGDVAAVGDPVVERDPEVERAVLERERAQHLVRAGGVLDRAGSRARGRQPGSSRRARTRRRSPRAPSPTVASGTPSSSAVAAAATAL